MITKRFKKILAAFLCMALLISQFYCDQALASDSIVSITYEQVNQKIVAAYEQGVEPLEILEELSEEEARILSSYYADYQSASVFAEEALEDGEAEYIDTLAAEYYNALEESGQIDILSDMSLEEADKVFDSVEIPQTLTVSRTAQAYASLDYSASMQEFGYSFTYEEIARQLVLIGSTIKLGSALPFLDLFAIVAGVLIVTLAVAVLYCAVAGTANELIGNWYLYHKEQIKASTVATAAVIAESQRGTKYWTAHRIDVNGKGGIVVGAKLEPNAAAAIVIANQHGFAYPDVFCLNTNDAHMLVQMVGNMSADFTGASTPVEVHTDKGIFNMPHIHAILTSGKQGYIHIFFFYPYNI